MSILISVLIVTPIVILVIGALGYLCGCAGANRWLTLREWWARSP